MKQLIQSYRTGELGIFEVPRPSCGENGVIVQTSASLVSAGTEKMVIELAKKSLAGKARSRPDLVKQVIAKMRQEGFFNTLEKVFNKLDTPFPLGYSCSGRVIEVGDKVPGVSLGDRVACGGSGYANHSEINYVPKNLFVKIPEGVDDEDASFITLGAIALQGVRQAEVALGEKTAVIGLGLIGLLTLQLLKAAGCYVIGSDPDSSKRELAEDLGCDVVCAPEELPTQAEQFSHGRGVDSVIITASSSNDQPVIDAGQISRLKGKVIVLGLVGMEIPRDMYYKKELELKLSMAYGPGRYDPGYEEKGIDYPFSYVRWTEQRNFEAFLAFIAEGKVDVKRLVSHSYSFDDALEAYEILEGKKKEEYLGILLRYESAPKDDSSEKIEYTDSVKTERPVRIGFLGAGNFARTVLLPVFANVKGFDLHSLCTATGVNAFSTGKKYHFKEITTDSSILFESEDINCVAITTRHYDHAGFVIEALENRKNVFVEKPLCLSRSELEKIRSVYTGLDTKPIIQVGYNRRFSSFIKRMRTEIADKPVQIQYRINAGLIPLDSWIQDPEIGGGRIIGEVCHFVDTCSFLADSEPASVFASCLRSNNQQIPDEDNLSIIITFKNQSKAVITYTAFGNNRLSKEYVEVFATNLAMRMDNFKVLEIYNGGRSKKLKAGKMDKGFANEVEEFKNGVLTGIPAIPFDSLYKTTKTTFEILESSKSGMQVEI